MLLRIRNKVNQHKIYIDTNNNELGDFILMDKIREEAEQIGIKLSIDFDRNIKIDYLCNSKIIETTELPYIVIYYTSDSDKQLSQTVAVYSISNNKLKLKHGDPNTFNGLTINDFVNTVNDTELAYDFIDEQEAGQLCTQ